LGITIVEIATGRFPYREWNCVIAQLNAVVDGDPPILLPSDGNPPFTLPLVELVRACLVKDPTLRPDYQKLLVSWQSPDNRVSSNMWFVAEVSLHRRLHRT
jgi:serine/threonine protein kinase